MSEEITVYVTLKMYEGLVDDVVVFTDEEEADIELENWLDEQKDWDTEGSTVYETQLIDRQRKD